MQFIIALIILLLWVAGWLFTLCLAAIHAGVVQSVQETLLLLAIWPVILVFLLFMLADEDHLLGPLYRLQVWAIEWDRRKENAKNDKTLP